MPEKAISMGHWMYIIGSFKFSSLWKTNSYDKSSCGRLSRSFRFVFPTAFLPPTVRPIPTSPRPQAAGIAILSSHSDSWRPVRPSNDPSERTRHLEVTGPVTGDLEKNEYDVVPYLLDIYVTG